MQINTTEGEPAFPVQELNDDGSHFFSHTGMSLRDYLAAQALAGMLAHSTRYRPRTTASLNWHVAIAEEAYELADAMLAARPISN